jgi:DNA polymerase-3 subunit beta
MLSYLETTAGELRAALAIIGRVEPGKFLPILQQVAVQGTTLTRTDLDLELSAVVPGAASGPHWLAPADALAKLVRGVDAGAAVTLQHSPGELTPGKPDARNAAERVDYWTPGLARLTCDGLELEVETLPMADWPNMTKADAAPTGFAMPAADLRAVLHTAAWAQSDEVTRYYLNGIYLHAYAPGAAGPSHLRAVSTDGHKLVQATTTTPYTGSGVILPSATVKALLAILGPKDKTTVQVAITPTRVILSAPGWAATSKVIDGTFPDYPRGVPSSTAVHFDTDAAALSKIVTRVASMGENKVNAVRIEPGAGLVSLSGAAKASAKFSCLLGQDWATLGVSSKYLCGALDLLTGLGSARALFTTPTEGDPIKIRPVTQPSWGDLTIIVMPMRV